MLIDIEKVIVKDRIRKDFGNIEELANDIKDHGLINPPVVTPDYELITGERRLRAMKHLSYNQIEVRIMTVRDYEHQLNLEISENEERKEFSRLERFEFSKRLAEVERLKAKERQLSKLNNQSLVSPNLDTREIGRTDHIVAQKSGFGGKDTLRKAGYIVENADANTLELWDKGDITTHKAYITLKQEKEAAEERANRECQLKQVLQNQKPKTIEVEKVVAPSDYEQNKKQLELLSKKLESSQNELTTLKKNRDSNEKQAKEYQELKHNIEFMKREKSNLSRQIESATEYAGLVVELDKILKERLAPIKFSRIIERMDSEVAVSNLTEIIEKVESWCREMRNVLPNNNIIDAEVIYE